MASVSEDKKYIFEEKNDSSYAEWIIKLPSLTENPKDGFVEWVYSQMAQKAGIEVPEYALFDSKNCAGFFGSKRFDRDGKNKIHTLSIGAVTGKYYLRESLSIRDHFDTVSRVAPQDLPALLKLLIFNRFGFII